MVGWQESDSLVSVTASGLAFPGRGPELCPQTLMSTQRLLCFGALILWSSLVVQRGSHRGTSGDGWAKSTPAVGRGFFHHQRLSQETQVQSQHGPSTEEEPVLSPSCELLPDFPECLLRALWSQLCVKTLGKPQGWHSKGMVTLWLQAATCQNISYNL